MTEVKYIREGNIFNSNAQAWINPVNTIGVSGAGLAKQFAINFPHSDKLYKKACKDGLCDIGLCYCVTYGEVPQYIIHFPTKKHFKDLSQIEYIRSGMVNLLKIIEINNIHSVACPMLGCGLGGLNPEKVLPLIVEPIWKKRGVSLEVYL